MNFYPFSIVLITEGFAPLWCQCSKFLSKRSLRFLCSFKCRSKSRENLYEIRQAKNEKVMEKCTYLQKIFLHFLKFLPYGSCFSIVQCGRLMEIQKLMIKCCRWCGRTKIIVLVRVSIILLFHKCLQLLRLGLYTISTLRVDNDSAIVAHICYISLLRCNYYY